MKYITFTLLAMISLLLLFACRTQAGKAALRIGIIRPSIDHLPLTLALHKGYLDSEDYKVIQFTSGWEVQEAISAGRIDLAIMPFTYAWTAIAKGYDLKIVSCLERETDGLVTSAKIQTIRDLHKRKIGLLRASTLEVLMQDLAAKNSIDFAPVYFRTPAEMIAALQTSDVDAVVSYVPLIQKMGAGFHVVHWFSDTYPGHPCCDLVAVESVSKNRRKELETVVSALRQAASELADPSAEDLALISKQYGLSREQVLDALEHTRFDVSLSEFDKQFERLMMNAFVENSYLSKLPTNKEVYSD